MGLEADLPKGQPLGYTLTPEERRALLEDLFVFGKSSQRPFLKRIAVLLLVSTVIAVCGLLSDSAAVVIGAMLVAPMMRPVMSSAAAICLGWSRRFWQSILLIWAMAFAAVAIAVGMSILAPHQYDLPEQVLARTVPTFFDLGIAIAAGAGGAYTMTRKESGAIPGVAMAVALLPPLASCGILMVFGDWNLALKAFVLFFINFAAMVLSATLTFVLVGVSPANHNRYSSPLIRIGLFGFTLLLVVISYPLYYYSHDVWYDDMYLAQSSKELQGWLKQNKLHLDDVKIDKEQQLLYLRLVGPNPPLDVEQLHTSIGNFRHDKLGENRPFRIEVFWTQSAQFSWPPEPIKAEDERQLKRDYQQQYANHTWRWVGTEYADGHWLRPKKVHDYLITAQSEDRIKINTACEEGEGSYILDQEFISMTLAMAISADCSTEKVDSRFIADINNVALISINDESLSLSMADKQGVIRFKRFP